MIVRAHKFFAEGLADEKPALIAVVFAADKTKVDIGNSVWRRFHWFSIAPDDPVPSVAIAGVGEQADRDVVMRSESCCGKIFMQRAAFTRGLIEAPERCWWVERLQGIR